MMKWGFIGNFYVTKTIVIAHEKEEKGFKKPKNHVILMVCANATFGLTLDGF